LTVAEYQYDGNNRRIAKRLYDAGTLDETRYVYYSAQSQAIEERVDSSSDAQRQFVWNLGYVDDLLLRDRDSNEDGVLNQRLYALTDLRYSVVAITSTSGAVQERYLYEGHGLAIARTSVFMKLIGSPTPNTLFDWEFRYTGRREDLETNLLYFRARYYSTELGRFISRDPLGFVDGMSLYRGYFVPGGIDPDGSQSQTINCKWKGKYDTMAVVDLSFTLSIANTCTWIPPNDKECPPRPCDNTNCKGLVTPTMTFKAKRIFQTGATSEHRPAEFAVGWQMYSLKFCGTHTKVDEGPNEGSGLDVHQTMISTSVGNACSNGCCRGLQRGTASLDFRKVKSMLEVDWAYKVYPCGRVLTSIGPVRLGPLDKDNLFRLYSHRIKCDGDADWRAP
jgi:RHS repeat-associated protein